MTKNMTLYGKTKHIDIRYHYVHDLVPKGEIIMKYGSTQA